MTYQEFERALVVSGVSKAEFCRLNGIAPTTISKWGKAGAVTAWAATSVRMLGMIEPEARASLVDEVRLQRGRRAA